MALDPSMDAPLTPAMGVVVAVDVAVVTVSVGVAVEPAVERERVAIIKGINREEDNGQRERERGERERERERGEREREREINMYVTSDIESMREGESIKWQYKLLCVKYVQKSHILRM